MEKKQRLGVILSTLGVVMILFGTTLSFFNYTRTGVSNVVKVGRISFESEQTNTITLLDVFPIDKDTVGSSNYVGTSTINIVGDTTYDDGVEYLLTVSNLTNTIGNKEIPIDVVVSASGIGTADPDYFDNRGSSSSTSIYKVLNTGTIENNQELLVGYIKKGSTGVNGTVTIKAYLDEDKIAISDTYPSGTVHTVKTTNYSSSDCETALTGVTNASTYCATSTSLQSAIDNNNLTANQITSLVTAGIVEEYTNGTPASFGEGKVVLTTEEWNSFQTNGVSFQVKVEANEGTWVEGPSAYNTIKKNVDTTTQINFAAISSASNGEGLYILPGTESNTYPIYYYRGEINNNNIIFGGFCWQMVRTTDTGGIKMIYNGIVTGSGETCENTTASSRQLTSTSTFNSQNNTVADVGYMKNARYTYTNAAGETGAIYGKNVEWDGNNYLVIEDTANEASSNTTKDNYHHYSCGTEGTTICGSIRYYYYNNYYITLTNGELIEDALYKMTGNGSTTIKQNNTGYVLNQNNSIIKEAIDTWFETNLTNVVDNTKTDYRSYLEDTIYCNDRSFKTESGSIATYEQSGWNPSGGDLTKVLFFGSLNRAYNDWYSTTNVPTTVCPNENDRFTVQESNGNGSLTYPVGLLTVDEIVMAGASPVGNGNSTYYLYTGNEYWSLSSRHFNYGTAFGFSVDYMGGLNSNSVDYSIGVRPVVSLKLGTEFESGGDGTPTNPYVVKCE